MTFNLDLDLDLVLPNIEWIWQHTTIFMVSNAISSLCAFSEVMEVKISILALETMREGGATSLSEVYITQPS